MHTYLRLLLAIVALLFGGAVWGQEPQRQGWLGAALEDITKEEADKLGWEAPRGAKVTELIKGAPAEAVGLEIGDIIATLDHVEIENSNEITTALIARAAGTEIKLRVVRGGRERTVTVALGARPGGLAVGTEKGPQLTLDNGGHMARVMDLAITPDGRQLVSASNDKTVRVWDLETGKTVRMIRGEVAPGDWGMIYAMALSPDGRRLAVGGYLHGNDRALASAVRLHDFATGKVEALLKGHSQVVFAVAFSPDGKRLVSGSGDNTAIVWDLTTRQPALRLRGHTKAVKAVAFTGDGERVVTGSDDETLRLWSAADGTPIAVGTEHKQASQRDAAKVAADSKRELKEADVWEAGVVAVAVSPTEPVIASGSADGRVMLWDGRTGAFVREIARMRAMRGWPDIFRLSFSPDGRWLLFTNTESGCAMTEAATGRYLYDGELRDAPYNLWEEHVPCNGGSAFSPDGRVAAAGYNSVIRLLDARTRKLDSSLGAV